jgi:hypothetical protein
MTDMTDTTIDAISVVADDAIELAELLDFIADWLTSAPRMVACDFERFVGADDYTVAELRTCLTRWSTKLLTTRMDPAR